MLKINPRTLRAVQKLQEEAKVEYNFYASRLRILHRFDDFAFYDEHNLQYVSISRFLQYYRYRIYPSKTIVNICQSILDNKLFCITEYNNDFIISMLKNDDKETVLLGVSLCPDNCVINTYWDIWYEYIKNDSLKYNYHHPFSLYTIEKV